MLMILENHGICAQRDIDHVPVDVCLVVIRRKAKSSSVELHVRLPPLFFKGHNVFSLMLQPCRPASFAKGLLQLEPVSIELGLSTIYRWLLQVPKICVEIRPRLQF